MRCLVDARAGCFDGWLLRRHIAYRASLCKGSLLCCVPTSIYTYLFRLYTIRYLLLQVYYFGLSSVCVTCHLLTVSWVCLYCVAVTLSVHTL